MKFSLLILPVFFISNLAFADLTPRQRAVTVELTQSSFALKACVTGHEITTGFNVVVSAVAEALPFTGDVLYALDALVGPNDYKVHEQIKDPLYGSDKAAAKKRFANTQGGIVNYILEHALALVFPEYEANDGYRTFTEYSFSKTAYNINKFNKAADACKAQQDRYSAAALAFNAVLKEKNE